MQTAPFAIIGDFGIHFQYGVSLERFQANNGKFGMECIIMFEALGDPPGVTHSLGLLGDNVAHDAV